ncbi:hypothetical protein AAULH_01058, partial [Lactobacillus helveticus MTCC 5463]
MNTVAYLNGEPNQVEVNTYTIPQKISLDDLHLTEALKKSLTSKRTKTEVILFWLPNFRLSL